MPRGGKRPGAGPKPLPPGLKKTTISIAVAPSDEVWLREKANDWQLSLSAVIALAIACLRNHPEEWPK